MYHLAQREHQIFRNTRMSVFRIKLTRTALDDLAFLSRYEQSLVHGAVQLQLSSGPTIPTRNRKRLRPNPLSDWELRVGALRIFYDVDTEERVVLVKAVGWKEHNRLFIRGKEFEL